LNTEMIKPTPVRSGSAVKPLWKSTVLKTYLTMLSLYIVSGVIEPHFFSVDHVIQLLVIASFLGILAVGQTLVILTGGLDLSIAYMLNLGAVIMTQVTAEHGAVLGLPIMLAAGLVVGLLNGLGVAYLNISPIIMTLAMSSILKSVTYVYSNGNPKGNAPYWLRYIGTESFLGIRIALWFWVVLAVIVLLLLAKTTFGRKIYAMGTNPKVAYLSGVNNKRTLILVYMLSALFAVLAGMISVGFYGLSYLGMGDTLLLPSIAAVVIGGTSIMGGRGGYAGTIAGTVIIYLLLSILTVLQISDAGRQIIYGLVILIVLFLYGRMKRTGS
jgi:ribose transport system permease protein